jgi:hypothetical protein
MGLLSFLGAGKAAGEAIATPVSAVGNVLDKLFTSDEERGLLDNAKAKLALAPHIAQSEINKVEASHRSIFVAGWRPAIGWVCALALATYYLPQHVMAAVLWVKMCWAASEMQPYPIDIKGLLELVLALLGLGGLRTFEKLSGRAK